MKSRVLALITAVMLALTCLNTAYAAGSASSNAKSAAKGNVIEVSLQTGSSRAKSNFKKLQAALKKGGTGKRITVRIKKAGSYYVHSGGGGALRLRSNTVLDLNGARLIRWGKMTNLLQNCNKKGKRTARGYSLSSNITVKNGTLDGSGGVKRQVNLVNIGHAANLTFSNLHFRNCRQGHLLELSGCKNVVVDHCSFSGHKGSTTSEAIQLDITKSGRGWNGIYAKGAGADCTPCKNVTISNCSFKDYPSGVGNHHAVKGHHNSNIKIINNQFTNKTSSNAPAIYCYAFDNSLVTGNVITGKYRYGIRVSGGSVTVKGNSIGTKNKKVKFRAIYVVRAHSNLKSGSNQVSETVTGGCIDANTVYSSYSEPPIFVSTSSHLMSVSDNYLYTDNPVSEEVVAVTQDCQVMRMSGNVRN